MHTFYKLGKKYEFFPLFSSPFNHFFPQHDIWPYFCPPPTGGGSNRNIYTPAVTLFKKRLINEYRSRM